MIRKLFPWWLLSLINRRTKTCWAHMVMWKMYPESGEWTSWWPSPNCWDGPGEGYDYCGRWLKREDFPLTQEAPR